MHKRVFLKNNLLAMTAAVVFGVLSQLGVLLIASLPLFILFKYGALSFTTLVVLGVLVPVVGLLRPFFRFLEQYFNHLVAFRILENYRLVLFKELKNTSLDLLTETYKSDFLTVLTKDIETLELFFAHTISPFFISVVLEVFVLAAAYFISPLLVLIVFCTHLLILLLYFISFKLSQSKFNETRSLFKTLTKVIFLKTSALRSIYMFGQTRQASAEIEEQSTKLNQKNVFLNLLIEGKMTFVTAFTTLLAVILTYFAKYLFKVEFASYFAPILFYLTLFLAFSLSTLFEQYALVQSADKRVKKVYAMPKENQVVGQTDITFESVCFKSVNFGYKPDQLVIKDLSFDIKVGEIFGVSGRSGVGKSTLVKLISGLVKPVSGEIVFNNRHKISAINTKSLNQNVSVLFQDEHIFKDTLRYNLTLGNSSIQDKAIIKAIEQAGLGVFFKNHNQNLDLELTPEHLNISTGEKFRIGLCRAILKNSRLIVLDEPTRFLDPENEENVLSIIANLKQNHAFLIITHKPRPFLICDKIIKLN